MDRHLSTAPGAGASSRQGVSADACGPSHRAHRSPVVDGRPFSAPPLAEPLRLSSDDGRVTYAVGSAGSRLFIQRSQCTRLGMLAEQCLLIPDRDGFHRWCATEPIRFQYPMLFDRLRRRGDEFFDRGV